MLEDDVGFFAVEVVWSFVLCLLLLASSQDQPGPTDLDIPMSLLKPGSSTVTV